MATLTAEERQKIRRALERYANENDLPIDYVKGAVNDAAQAIEDQLTNVQASISAAVDAATAPYGISFTAAQKKIIGAYVFAAKYERDRS